MPTVFFYVRTNTATGLPEFFLEEPNGDRHDFEIDHVRQSLESMLQQLRFFACSDQLVEYDLSFCDQELVFWELEPADSWYETTTADRVATTIAEVEYQLEVLSDLEKCMKLAEVNW